MAIQFSYFTIEEHTRLHSVLVSDHEIEKYRLLAGAFNVKSPISLIKVKKIY